MNRERWLAIRRTGIGASEAASVAGVGSWGSPMSVWLDKLGMQEEREPSERMDWGLILERPIAAEWARRVGATGLRSVGLRRHPTIPHILATPDFVAHHPVDGRVLIEVKNTDSAAGWREGEAVPTQYFLQVQHQLMTVGLDVAYLVVLVRGNRLMDFRVEADAEVQAELIATYADFWDCVVTKTPPPVDDSDATVEALRRMYPRDDGEEIIATPDEQQTIRRLLDAKQERAAADRALTEAKSQLKMRMGSASRMLWAGGSISWRTTRDSVVTDWGLVATAYRKMAEALYKAAWAMGANVSEPDFTAVESIYTMTKPGDRPFVVTAAEEE